MTDVNFWDELTPGAWAKIVYKFNEAGHYYRAYQNNPPVYKDYTGLNG